MKAAEKPPDIYIEKSLLFKNYHFHYLDTNCVITIVIIKETGDEGKMKDQPSNENTFCGATFKCSWLSGCFLPCRAIS